MANCDLFSYTMNLAQATQAVLEELKLIPSEETPLQRPLPWRPSLALNRRGEDVRPIFWRNRNSSYIARTQTWDEFPNGRWTDSRSPAFGELDAYGIGLKGTNEQNIKLWGEPKSIRDVTQIFVRYLEGKLDRLPWSDSPISGEANAIKNNLVQLNSRGLLTVNSQPAVNGVRSSHPVYGWGPKNGFVYQKAYLELFVPPYLLDELIARIEKNPDMTYHAVAKNRELRTNTRDSPNALTWGIFAGREIVQPTIVETISFLAWKDEAYRLGEDWAKCHDASSPSRKLIQDIMDNWYLVNIGKFADRSLHVFELLTLDISVNNDFHNTYDLFDLFNGLEVKDLDIEVSSDTVEIKSQPNGAAPEELAVKN